MIPYQIFCRGVERSQAQAGQKKEWQRLTERMVGVRHNGNGPAA